MKCFSKKVFKKNLCMFVGVEHYQRPGFYLTTGFYLRKYHHCSSKYLPLGWTRFVSLSCVSTIRKVITDENDVQESKIKIWASQSGLKLYQIKKIPLDMRSSRMQGSVLWGVYVKWDSNCFAPVTWIPLVSQRASDFLVWRDILMI